jgi:hypothetical protein
MWPLIREHMAKLRDELTRRGVDSNTVKAAYASGYIYTEAMPPFTGETTPCVGDTFYGSKWYTGLIPIDTFVDWIRGGEHRRSSRPIRFVRWRTQ